MSYLPHTVLASTGALYGNVVDVSMKDLSGAQYVSRRGSAMKYPIYLTLSLVNVPGGKKLYGVRYLGLLELIWPVANEPDLRFSAVANFDEIVERSLDPLEGNKTFEQVAANAAARLSGSVVAPINVGGRWVVQ